MKEENLILIDGIYTPENTKEILFSLIQDKIRFLNVKLDSLAPDFSLSKSHITERVKELRLERDALLNYLDQFKAGVHELEIYCEVKIKPRVVSS